MGGTERRRTNVRCKLLAAVWEKGLGRYRSPGSSQPPHLPSLPPTAMASFICHHPLHSLGRSDIFVSGTGTDLDHVSPTTCSGTQTAGGPSPRVPSFSTESKQAPGQRLLNATSPHLGGEGARKGTGRRSPLMYASNYNVVALRLRRLLPRSR